MKFAPNELSLINKTLSEHVGLPLSTIDRAAVQGRLQTYHIGTQGETRVVRVADVVNWKNHNYQPEKANKTETRKKAK
jgi:uncharacterized protein YfaT (DUF1175 family)